MGIKNGIKRVGRFVDDLVQEYFFGEKTRSEYNLHRGFIRECILDSYRLEKYLASIDKQEQDMITFGKTIPNVISLGTAIYWAWTNGASSLTPLEISEGVRIAMSGLSLYNMSQHRAVAKSYHTTAQIDTNQDNIAARDDLIKRRDKISRELKDEDIPEDNGWDENPHGWN